MNHTAKQRLFGWLNDAAGTLDRARRLIGKAEHSAQGRNPRFMASSLPGDPQALYEEVHLRARRDGTERSE
jgi:hypothetical protein